MNLPKLISVLLITIIWSMDCIESLAQQSCTRILNEASAKYADGVLNFIEEPDFKNCFTRHGGFTPEEVVAAHKLVTKVHIYEDRVPEAEESMIKLLKADPEHSIDKALDPYEFIYLYNKFRTKPIFRVGGRVGINYATMSVIEEFGVSNVKDDGLEKAFSPEIGVSVGAYLDYNFWHNFEVSLGVNYAQKSVSFRNSLYKGFNPDTYYSTTIYKDDYTFIDIPLVVKYNFGLSPNLVIYPYGGVLAGILLSAKRSGRREVVSPPSIDLTKLGNAGISVRSYFNYAYTTGLGIKIKSKTDYITAELGVSIGGNNFVEPDGRYQSDDLVFRLGQVDDNLKLSSLSFRVGYQKSIYNPKKLKQYRDK